MGWNLVHHRFNNKFRTDHGLSEVPVLSKSAIQNAKLGELSFKLLQVMLRGNASYGKASSARVYGFQER